MTIDDLRSKQNGWKGPDSVPPKAENIDTAERIVKLFGEPMLLGACSDGEIVIEYRERTNSRFSMSVMPDGEIVSTFV